MREGSDKNWTHEDQSVRMIKDMIDSACISLYETREGHDYAVELISSLITGDCETWQRLLKPSEMYLTEIVSNKFCNIDVDKCDYLLRDCFHVKRDILPFVDFMNSARVVVYGDGNSHIAYRVEDFELIESMFRNRASYHKHVYQQVDVMGIERQLLDVCLSANSAGLVIDDLPITEIQRDCQAYLKLDDTVIDLIRESEIQNKTMMQAQDLLQRMDNEQYYTFVYESSGDCKALISGLVTQFGDIFCTASKHIPNANIPKNIPLYDSEGSVVQRVSERQLSYESTLLFCKAFDNAVLAEVQEFIGNINNNNY